LWSSSPRGFAQVYTLTSSNSSVDIYPFSQTGMNNWKVDGVNQLGKQWFWCRDGYYEYSLDSLRAQAPVIVWNGGNQLTTTYYDESNYTFSVHYTLSGGVPGSDTSSLLENVAIHNAAATPLTLHVFQYSDFDVGGTGPNDTVTLNRDGFNKFYQAVQTDPTGLKSITTVSLGANHGEANYYSNTLTSLTDLHPTTLNDTAGPLGPGDMTWALQWDFVIGAGATVNIDILKQITVPEPSVCSLFIGALMVRAVLRRGRRRPIPKS
jgi:hypothetical protein